MRRIWYPRYRSICIENYATLLDSNKSETCNVIYYVYTYYISAYKLRSDLLILFPLSAFTKCRTLLLAS